MSKVTDTKLSCSQGFYLLTGIIISVGILSLPNSVVKISAQDGWISAAIGSLYPFYIVIMAYLLKKADHKDDILAMSKIVFGKFFGSFFNLLFGVMLLFYLCAASSAICDFLRTYMIDFISPFEFYLLFFICVLYGALKELRVLSDISKVLFYFVVIVLFMPLASLKYGSILNLLPVTEISINRIIRGSFYTIFSYSGIEIILLIINKIDKPVKIKKAGLLATAFILFTYTYITFTTIFYLSPEVVVKILWPATYVVESIRLPVINSFRLAIIFAWLIVVLNSISLLYHFSGEIFLTVIKIKKWKLCYALYPIAILGAFLFGNVAKRRMIVDNICPYFALYMVMYVTLIFAGLLWKVWRYGEKK